MKKLLVLSTGILWLGAQNLITQPVFADGDIANMRHVSVSGSSRQQFAPDQAILSMSLVTKNADLREAKRENDAMVERLVKITREFKVPTRNVANSNVYIAPQYHYQQDKEPKLIGYQVSRQMRITMDSLEIHEKLLSAIVDARINQVNGIEFRLSNPEKHAMGLRTQAFDNAREKAALLANAADSKLGKALVISTTGSSVDMPQPPRPMMAKAMRAESADMMSVAPSLPGMVELEETVNVSFALE
jgi:uncharacterized protein